MAKPRKDQYKRMKDIYGPIKGQLPNFTASSYNAGLRAMPLIFNSIDRDLESPDSSAVVNRLKGQGRNLPPMSDEIALTQKYINKMTPKQMDYVWKNPIPTGAVSGYNYVKKLGKVGNTSYGLKDMNNFRKIGNHMNSLKEQGYTFEEGGEILKLGLGGDVLSGALQGGAAGSVVPGWGTLIGGAAGAGVALMKGLNEQKQEGNQQDLINNQAVMQDRLSGIQPSMSYPPIAQNGGNLPGVANDGNLLEYKGQTHNGPNGGISVDELGNPTRITGKNPVALTEDGEVAWHDPQGQTPYIFSKKLGFADKAKKLMKQYNVNAKTRGVDKMLDESVDAQLTQLKTQQELVKPKQTNNQLANGGPLSALKDRYMQHRQSIKDTMTHSKAVEQEYIESLGYDYSKMKPNSPYEQKVYKTKLKDGRKIMDVISDIHIAGDQNRGNKDYLKYKQKDVLNIINNASDKSLMDQLLQKKQFELPELATDGYIPDNPPYGPPTYNQYQQPYPSMIQGVETFPNQIQGVQVSPSIQQNTKGTSRMDTVNQGVSPMDTLNRGSLMPNSYQLAPLGTGYSEQPANVPSNLHRVEIPGQHLDPIGYSPNPYMNNFESPHQLVPFGRQDQGSQQGFYSDPNFERPPYKIPGTPTTMPQAQGQGQVQGAQSINGRQAAPGLLDPTTSTPWGGQNQQDPSGMLPGTFSNWRNSFSPVENNPAVAPKVVPSDPNFTPPNLSPVAHILSGAGNIAKWGALKANAPEELQSRRMAAETVDYSKERLAAQETANVARATASRTARDVGANAGMAMSGMNTARTGVDRLLGNQVGQSVQRESNTNAQLQQQANAVNLQNQSRVDQYNNMTQNAYNQQLAAMNPLSTTLQTGAQYFADNVGYKNMLEQRMIDSPNLQMQQDPGQSWLNRLMYNPRMNYNWGLKNQ